MPSLVPAPRQVVANLPYNIATPLLIGWLRQARAFERLTLMFQQEVAERICAAPDTAAYGRLSVLAQWTCRAELLLRIPPAAFVPPPKVFSAVVGLVPHAEQPAPALFPVMERLTAAAFGQRRKMLRGALKAARWRGVAARSRHRAGSAGGNAVGGRVRPAGAAACYRRSTASLRPVSRTVAEACRMEHATDRGDGLIQIVIHHHMVEFRPMADLVARQPHATGDLRRIVARSMAQPALQRGQRRRQDEHADHVFGQRRPQLPMALPVDVEHHVLAVAQRLLDRCARRAVAVPAQHACPFQQFARRDHAVEFRLVAEVIVHAVRFAGTQRARGDADRAPQIRLARQQRIGDRGLAGTGRCRQHQAHAAPRRVIREGR